MADKKEREVAKKKDFIWLSLRISFWIMVGLWLISTIYGTINPVISYNPFWIILSVIWMISIIFTFVDSIVHLNKYKAKAMAVVALVISSVFILWIIIVFLIGVGGGAA